jgi:CBS domain containing-hemolysin-like protein
MYAIDLDDERDAIIAQILNSPFSRIPFYEKSVDNIMGILIVNRFYRRIIDNPDLDIREILMEPIYLYRTTKMPAALNQLRKSQIHMGIVTDDYGGNMGIITIEDIMETIVGEIWDENDVVYNEIRQVDENTYELDGDLSISEFLELVDWDEDDFEFESDTLGGWCIEMKEGFPNPGDTFQYENITVTVLAMDNLRVDRLKVSIDRMHDQKKDNN